MSDGRRRADDGNSSIRAMKTSSDRKLMEIFIFNTMSAGRWGHTKHYKKPSILECFQCQWLCPLVCPVNKKSLIHSKANHWKAKNSVCSHEEFLFCKVLCSRILVCQANSRCKQVLCSVLSCESSRQVELLCLPDKTHL